MLIEFIVDYRLQLIARTRAKVAARRAPLATARELESGVPLFLEQLVETLRGARSEETSNLEQTAALHGAALLQRGYTVAQVVHDYGDICQAITELAEQLQAPITTEEFHTLNLSLDNAIAQAVSEYMRLHDQSLASSETERAGSFAHELRNKITVAQLGFQLIRAGRTPIGGSVAAVVTRSLQGMIGLIDRTLVEVRLDSGTMHPQRVHLRQILEDAEVGGGLEAQVRGVGLSVAPLEPELDVEADPQILAGAVANLMQNAFKFTRAGGRVRLGARRAGSDVHIEVQDECGGLPPGKAEELFGAFQQRGKNRDGLGLGLFISRKGVEASGGSILVRDLPGSGCVFTIVLPLLSP